MKTALRMSYIFMKQLHKSYPITFFFFFSKQKVLLIQSRPRRHNNTSGDNPPVSLVVFAIFLLKQLIGMRSSHEAFNATGSVTRRLWKISKCLGMFFSSAIIRIIYPVMEHQLLFMGFHGQCHWHSGAQQEEREIDRMAFRTNWCNCRPQPGCWFNLIWPLESLHSTTVVFVCNVDCLWFRFKREETGAPAFIFFFCPPWK